ncbi:hypothetical protein J7T55_004678 [Diaporthe amygdali]|uniref:uncharacterized protein n=1 Tax=Phomopsis amygdali TaxID=1214568 RepID=UPI0022FEC73D|nr:uncharacterized protein J7T55_004678 [Diaporthe amygdali]KAJ0114935.1 hypothetical protein J7T55_004678 [Diaporthe amygdali]
MPPYQQHPAPQSWDRWPQHQSSSDYVMMDNMVGYDTRTLPSSAPLQRPVMAPQYVMGNSYADSPVTPMSASNYPGPSQFSDYGSYNQPSPSLTSPFQQHPDRFSHRPMAPPTPPLDPDSHSIYSRDGQASYGSRDTSRRSSTKPVTVVKTEDVNGTKESKTIEPFKKEDGSLQWMSNEKFDCLLRMIPKALNLGDQKEEEEEEEEKPAECIVAPVAKKEPDTKAPLKKYNNATSAEFGYHRQEICRLFKQRGNVKPHIENVHEKKNKVVCNFPRCGKDFTTIGNMKNHIGKVHKAVLDELLYKMENWNENDKLDDTWVKLFQEYRVIFKNSNKGIKGRGHKEGKTLKHEQNAVRNRINVRRETQQMTPVSPEPIHVGAVAHNRSQYYEHHQQSQPPFHGLPLPAQPQAQTPFHGLPLPAQQQQPTPHYTPISMHAPQTQPYHTLPTPMGSNMGWTPQYQ